MFGPLAPTRVSVTFHPGEATESLLLRYANKLGLAPSHVVASLGVKPATTVAAVSKSGVALRHLAHIGGFTEIELVRQSFGSLNRDGEDHTGDVGFRPTFNRRRIAPGVLRSDGADPWVRRNWLIDCLPCDVETGEVLHHRCPCGRELDWNRCLSVAHCHNCGLDLRDMPIEFVSAGLLRTARILAALIDDRMPAAIASGLPGDLAGSSSSTLLDLCSLGEGLERSVHAHPHRPVQVLRIGSGMRLVEKWPISFDRLILAHLRAHEREDPQFGRARAMAEMRLKAGLTSPPAAKLFMERVVRTLGLEEAEARMLLQGSVGHRRAAPAKLDERSKGRSARGTRSPVRSPSRKSDRGVSDRRSA
jgi:hypothetical protein